MEPEEREQALSELVMGGFLIKTERGYQLSIPEPTPEQRRAMILQMPVACVADLEKEYGDDVATITPKGRAALDSGVIIENETTRLLVEVIARAEGATMAHVSDLVMRLSLAFDGDDDAAAEAVRSGRVGFQKAN